MVYEFNKEIEQSFTNQQRIYLQMLYDECLELGANYKMLAPLAALIYRDWDPLTEEEIENMKNDPRIMAMIRRSLQDIKEGKMLLWSEVKKELDL